MGKLGEAIRTFTDSQLVPLGITVIILAVVVVGFAFVGGTRQMLDWAKNHIFHIAAGAVLIYLAADIAQSFISSLGYSGF